MLSENQFKKIAAAHFVNTTALTRPNTPLSAIVSTSENLNIKITVSAFSTFTARKKRNDSIDQAKQTSQSV